MMLRVMTAGFGVMFFGVTGMAVGAVSAVGGFLCLSCRFCRLKSG
jgi:hypothetical protein